MQQDLSKGIRVPPELHGVQPRPLEEYVRARMLQFAQALASRLSPSLSPQMAQTAAFDAIQSLPPPDYGGIALESRDLQLVFRHDCLSLGCLDAQCVLCEHNPHRRCSVNFAGKYLVNDVLRAKCDAPIRVEIIDRATGQPVTEDIPDVALEMCVLDGNAYDQKVVEAGEEREGDLESCALLLNNKAQPLLVTGAGGTHNAQSKVVVSLSKGTAVLPDLHVSDSSEAMLSGRKPPFRLLVRVIPTGGGASGAGCNIRHAVSEGFVVATRRTRTAGKVEIPNVDDHVSKLEHMGKETVKKLQDIRSSAQQVGIDLNVPDNTINKVGEFRKLALLAEADGHLRQKLQQVLKLSKEKWDEARDHALKAVVADNRMRIWYADKQNMEVGLLFTCRLGNVDLERPVGLLTKKSQEGAQTTMEATLMAQQTPTQRDQVRLLQPQAVAAWWQPGHPGWAIYPVDSEQFMSTGALDSASLPAPEHIHAASPMLPPSPTAVAGGPPASPGPLPPPQPFTPALANAFGLGPVPPGDMLRALSPYMPGAGPPFLAQQLAAAQQAVQQQQQQAGASQLGSGPAGPGGPGVPLPPVSGAGSGGSRRGPSPVPPSLSQDASTAPPRAMPPLRQGSQALPSNGSAVSIPVPQPPPVTSPFAAPPLAGPGPSIGPFRAGLPMLDPSFSIGHLSQLFGGDLSKFPQLAGQLAVFPSIPQGAISADLEQLLQHHAAATAAVGGSSPGGEVGDGGAGGVPFFNMGHLSALIPKMESMELPVGEQGMGLGGGAEQDMVRLQGRAPSTALETMQSIENALTHLDGNREAEAGGGLPSVAEGRLMGSGEERRRVPLAGQKRK